MIKINTYEEKFLEILKGKSTLTDFENWLYQNEEILTTELSSEIYNDLILLNYNTKESKYELARALEVDYEKLELYEIQQTIANELKQKPTLNSVNYEIDVYELDFISYDFQIGSLKFRMHNPFEIENFPNLTNAERERIFYENFGSGEQFLKYLIDSIGSKDFRVHNWKKFEQTDSMTEMNIIQTKESEYKLLINSHYCYIKKEYIKQKMKKAWI